MPSRDGELSTNTCCTHADYRRHEEEDQSRDVQEDDSQEQQQHLCGGSDRDEKRRVRERVAESRRQIGGTWVCLSAENSDQHRH